MKIFLAGGYLEQTANYLTNKQTNRLFFFYDLITKRVNMNKRFNELKIFLIRNQ